MDVDELFLELLNSYAMLCATICQKSTTNVLQVALKYALGTGQVVIPRSKSVSHMKESLQLDSVHFSSKELKLLVNLDGRLR
jgi:diketogulonate reductase-like aldo/keto reductase